ncbi:MAG: 50S ribosomal protein L21 [Oscillospiraceae bacterium]|jgi:large subunit ribosomal protein L21|nr:50S ribosomal protein L21 [Oscillospiraceae bacterium]
MYAIIEVGGKQHKVKQNDVLFTNKLDAQSGEIIDLKVLAVSNGRKLEVGLPYVASAKVSAEVVKNGKAKKITVFTYKPKKNQSRKLGHRQLYSMIKIKSINS